MQWKLVNFGFAKNVKNRWICWCTLIFIIINNIIVSYKLYKLYNNKMDLKQYKMIRSNKFPLPVSQSNTKVMAKP